MPVSAEQAPHVRLGALVAQGVASGNGRRVLPNAASLRLLRASRIAECGALAPFAGSRSRERRARRAPNTVVAYCRMRRPCAFCGLPEESASRPHHGRQPLTRPLP